jgi:hypothetical protein
MKALIAAFFLLIAVLHGDAKTTVIARLKTKTGIASLQRFAKENSANIVNLNPFTKKELHFELRNYSGSRGHFDEDDFEIETVASYTAHVINDPLYGDQDYLPFIRAPDAWTNFGMGSPDQVVAIVDSGRLLNTTEHGNFWQNLVDNAPANGQDEDNDGYADDFNGGWDVVDSDNAPFEDGLYNSAQNYYFSHGSFVWSTVAGKSNAYGGIGVASNCKVVIVRAGHIADGTIVFDAADLLRAMDYLVALKDIGVDMRAHVASYGGYSPSVILKQATEATLGPKTVFAASAGNYNRNNDVYPMYPCSYSIANKLCVGAVDLPSGSRSSYSNYGNVVDISAPGRVLGPVYRPGTGQLFAWAAGTSFSGPEVAGAVMVQLQTPTSVRLK